MRWVVIVLTCLLLAGCTVRTAPTSGTTAEMENLRSQLAAREQAVADLQKQVADLQRDNTELKKQLSTSSPAPGSGEIAVGHGDGHFLVMPGKVHPGESIAVYTESTGGTIRILTKAGLKEVATFPGPAPGCVTLYSLPRELTAGEYLVTFSGQGGTSGEAEITVAQGQ